MYAYEQASVVLTNIHVQGNVYQPDVYGGAFNLDGNATLNLSACTVGSVHAQQGACVQQ